MTRISKRQRMAVDVAVTDEDREVLDAETRDMDEVEGMVVSLRAAAVLASQTMTDVGLTDDQAAAMAQFMLIPKREKE